jgi:hypothetical protein
MERGNENSVALFKPSLMKKVFLFTFILGFSFASAQQNDFFDAQKYLKKKSIEEKEKIINPLSKILKPGCGTTDKNLSTLPNYKKPILLPKDKKFIPNYYNINSSNQSSPLGKLTHTLPNGNKVYALPQDHMPCIIPNMGQFTMPNTFKHEKRYPSLLNKVPGNIPNSAIPLSELTTAS